MHSCIIHIGRVGIGIPVLITVVLLLVHDEMLCIGNNTSVLDTFNCLGHGNPSQDGVGGETCPVSTYFLWK